MVRRMDLHDGTTGKTRRAARLGLHHDVIEEPYPLVESFCVYWKNTSLKLFKVIGMYPSKREPNQDLHASPFSSDCTKIGARLLRYLEEAQAPLLYWLY